MYTNLGTLETQGVDLSFTWTHKAGPGDLTINSTGTWLDYFRYQPDPDARLIDATGTIAAPASNQAVSSNTAC